MTEYTIMAAATPGLLAELVQGAMQHGFKPVGGLVQAGDQIAQALTKETPDRPVWDPDSANHTAHSPRTNEEAVWREQNRHHMVELTPEQMKAVWSDDQP